MDERDATEGLAQQIRAAAASGTPLRIRGGGSKDFYGEPCEGELLDTRVLAGVAAYEPSELYVTARAGMPLAELETLLAAQGQCLPFEPPHFAGAATVGGMVASGLSGPARASVGALREYVLGLTMLDGRGERLTFGGQVMKNVAGYDVSRLVAGSLGILGVIAEVSLKVMPVAPAEATLRFACGQAEALQRLHAWGAQPLPLNASRWIAEEGQGALDLRLRGAAAAVDAACRQLGGERLDDASAAADWLSCRDQRLTWFDARGDRELWRLSVPQTAPVLDLPEPPLVEWHGGLRWVRATSKEGEALRAQARAVGGHATLFIAKNRDGARHTARFDSIAPPLMAIHRRLKASFDPAGIFNRGRMYADL